MNRRTYFDFVNIAKWILAVAIMAMHCALVPDHSLAMILLCRLGVPFFFAASGFFLWKKCREGQTETAVRGYLKRLLLPYAVFSIIWIAQLLIDDFTERLSFRQSSLKLLQYILFYPRGALWYVWASILGVLMLFPFMKKKKLLHALPLGTAMFLIGLLANNYYFIACDYSWLRPIVDGYLRVFLVSNNAPFVGFLFLLIGMLSWEYYDKLAKNVSLPLICGSLLLSCVLLVWEDSFIESRANGVGDGAFYVSQLVYVPTVFFLTTRIPCPHLSRSLITLAKNLSTGIYFLHVPILWIIHRSAAWLLPRVSGLSRIAPYFDHPSVCFVSCLALCLLICLLAYRRPKSFLCRILK